MDIYIKNVYSKKTLLTKIIFCSFRKGVFLPNLS